jgi:hypothetical protein
MVTAEQLLRAWEATLDEPDARRGATLLAVCLDRPEADVARWDVGRRDDALFALRSHLFGSEANALIGCPKCDERLEVALDIDALQPGPPVELGGIVRLPNSDDLVAVASTASEDEAVDVLVSRCTETSPTDIDRAAVRRLLASALDAVDVELELTCVACAATWRAPFDIGRFLLREVDAWARLTLRDVHTLAQAYGWSERTILGLSARRRRAYLDLVEAGR